MLNIKDLDLYPQPPTNTRSLTLNSEEPANPPTRISVTARMSMTGAGLVVSCGYVSSSELS